MGFNKILDKILHDDNIADLSIVHIKFRDKILKTLLFNKVQPLVFEKTN